MMRLPRVRLRMSTLLVLVAAVAGNCGVLRFLVIQQGNYRSGDRKWDLLAETLVSVLPLVNVAVIGGTLYLIQRIRMARRRGDAVGESTSPSAWTYFSLQFVLIAFVFAFVMPDEFERTCATATGPMWWLLEACSLAKNGSLNEEMFPSRAFGLILDMVMCSAPILALIGVGRFLAGRYASTATRRRFRVMTGLVSSGFAMVALAIVTTPQVFNHEDREVALSFRIVDRDSAQPVPSAFVRLRNPFASDSIPPCTFTDADGRAVLTGRFAASGERNLFREMGVISTWGRWLEVAAPGFQTARLALPEVLSPTVDLESTALGKVTLTRGETPEPQFGDLAGYYHTPFTGYGGTTITIDPDGRFAWYASSCTYRHREYGHLKRDEGEIVLVPITQMSEDFHPYMSQRYRAIQWGDSQYLSTTEPDEIRSFCRSALALNHPIGYRRLWSMAGQTKLELALNRPAGSTRLRSMMRETDQEKPLTGWPQLPAKVWVGFVLDEMSLRNEEGLLRLAIESLILKKASKRRESSGGIEKILSEVDNL
jgi:hypothetical protein